MTENKLFTNEMALKLNNMIDNRMKPMDTCLGRMERSYLEMKLELMEIRKEIRMSDKLLRLVEIVNGQSEEIKKLREVTERAEWLE